VESMPPASAEILKTLMVHWHMVAVAENEMTAHSLATCSAMLLMGGAQLSRMLAKYGGGGVKAFRAMCLPVKMLIMEALDVFPDVAIRLGATVPHTEEEKAEEEDHLHRQSSKLKGDVKTAVIHKPKTKEQVEARNKMFADNLEKFAAEEAEREAKRRKEEEEKAEKECVAQEKERAAQEKKQKEEEEQRAAAQAKLDYSAKMAEAQIFDEPLPVAQQPVNRPTSRPSAGFWGCALCGMFGGGGSKEDDAEDWADM